MSSLPTWPLSGGMHLMRFGKKGELGCRISQLEQWAGHICRAGTWARGQPTPTREGGGGQAELVNRIDSPLSRQGLALTCIQDGDRWGP